MQEGIHACLYRWWVTSLLTVFIIIISTNSSCTTATIRTIITRFRRSRQSVRQRRQSQGLVGANLTQTPSQPSPSKNQEPRRVKLNGYPCWTANKPSRMKFPRRQRNPTNHPDITQGGLRRCASPSLRRHRLACVQTSSAYHCLSVNSAW